MSYGLRDRVRLALSQDPRLVISQSEIENSPGHKPEYFEELGLRRTDLKKLVRLGLAMRGYFRRQDGSFEARYILVGHVE